MMLNPVLRRELKTRLRTWKSSILIMLYLLVLVGVGGLFLAANTLNSYMRGFNPQDAITIYVLLAGFQLGLVMLIAPALTAGSISGERERQTLDLILITKMSPFSIVMGKLAASLSHMILLIVASLPIFSLVFLYGGVSLWNVVVMFCFFLLTALFLGSLGLFCSTFFKRTTVSTVVAFMLVLALSVGSLIVLALLHRFSYGIWQKPLSYEHTLWIVGVNPFIGFLSVVGDQVGFEAIFSILNMHNNPNKITIQPWQVNIIFDLVLSFIFIMLSIWRIRPVQGRVKKSKTKKSEKVKNDLEEGSKEGVV